MNNQQEIQEFLNFNSWFSVYKTKPGGRYYTFKSALNLFLQNPDSKIIVETGCIRQPEDWGAGNSTYLFGEFCQKYKKTLYTIDNNAENLDLAKNITEKFKDNIIYVFSDSIKFLDKFTKPIDFLYLDSLDCPIEESSDASEAQKHALRELLAVYKNLTERAIVMVDDNDWENGGKSLLVKRYLFENNWRCIADERQSLWIK